MWNNHVPNIITRPQPRLSLIYPPAPNACRSCQSSKTNEETNSKYVDNNSALLPSGPDNHTAVCHLAAQISDSYSLPSTRSTTANTITTTTLPAPLPPRRTPPTNLHPRPPLHAPALQAPRPRPTAPAPPPPPNNPPSPRPPPRKPPNLHRSPSPSLHDQYIHIHEKFWQLRIHRAEVFGAIGTVAERGGEESGG